MNSKVTSLYDAASNSIVIPFSIGGGKVVIVLDIDGQILVVFLKLMKTD
ncbi:hypothetical protein O9993_05385 [Vibrio lentus]|nr:hypothetical protein [Vibrio lentus]